MIRKAVTVMLTTLPLMSLSQAGCTAWVCDSYFHPSEHRWGVGGGRASFQFEVNDCQFGGDLTATKTMLITFLPGLTVLVFNDNPYHLQLWRGKAGPYVRVTSVALETATGRQLYSTEGRPDVFPKEQEPDWYGVPVFVKNPKWKGWYRRWSSRDGWPNSQPVSIPPSCDELNLKLEYERTWPGETAPRKLAGTVTLRRYRRTWYGLALKDVFRATGGMDVKRSVFDLSPLCHSYARTISVSFCPPNPKPLESAVRTAAWRAWLGT